MDGMRIELLVVPDCPHEAEAAGVLRQALDDVGLGRFGVTVTVVNSQRDADDRWFIGSPTFWVDGQDVFPRPERAPAIACRVYPGTNSGVPDLRDLRQALKRAAAPSTSQ